MGVREASKLSRDRGVGSGCRLACAEVGTPLVLESWPPCKLYAAVCL